MRFVTVRYEKNPDRPWTYTDEKGEYNVGDRVLVPMRNQQVIGIVDEVNVTPPSFVCKPVISLAPAASEG